MTQTRLEYLRLLSAQFPTIAQTSSQIINLEAILNLPKGTEHFLSDLHGEAEPFLHMLRNASGVVREKIDLVYGNTLPASERRELATLIYYPQQKLELIERSVEDLKEWYRITLLRLIEVCRVTASKYARSKVRKALPEDFAYILEELLSYDDSPDRKRYYERIIDTIIEIDSAEAFVIELCNLIQRLAIDCLHIIGDIYDRGPGAHLIVDTLCNYHNVDVQWGNHDILWMGAAAGSAACQFVVLTTSLKYGNTRTLEDGYGINLRPLATFALTTYADDPCEQFAVKAAQGSMAQSDQALLSRMHKAAAVILFKLEGRVIERHPEYHMEARNLLRQVDSRRWTVTLEGGEYPMLDQSFPTVDWSDPLALTPEEEDLVEQVAMSFAHSALLQKHVRFLYASGSMFKCINGNLLYHGCIPMQEDGSFTRVDFYGQTVWGKRYLESTEQLARQGYFALEDTAQRCLGQDFLWYLWCGGQSPLFAKDHMTTFERYFVADVATHVEHKNPYYALLEGERGEEVARSILMEFGLDPDSSRIINGHMPVRRIRGESPIKANGRMLIIDGGLSRAYQSQTGTAGYTLIHNSHGLQLICHEAFMPVSQAIRTNSDLHSTPEPVARFERRARIEDTDLGREIARQVEELKELLQAYRMGVIAEGGARNDHP